MIIKKNKSFFFLIITFFLLSFFLYYYFISTNKGSIKIKNINEISDISNSESGITKFSDVEYKAISKNNKEFITMGKQANISKNQPNLVQVLNVHSFTKLNDGSILNVRSDKAEYNKNNNNIRYYQNVVITNKAGVITADKGDFFANKNLIKLEKVIYKDDQNLIKADFAILNTLSNNLEMFMENKKSRVYGQRKK